jgi:hypothetical protein
MDRLLFAFNDIEEIEMTIDAIRMAADSDSYAQWSDEMYRTADRLERRVHDEREWLALNREAIDLATEACYNVSIVKERKRR